MVGKRKQVRLFVVKKEVKKLKKVKRILAIFGVILLVGMYVLTFISSIFATEETGNLFRACIYCTITIPCLLYGFELIYRLLRGKGEQKEKKEE